MDILEMLPASTSIFMDKIYRDFSSTRNKFVRACDQVQRLNGRLYQLQERYERALWNHQSEFAYSYKAQMICVEGVLCVFEEYVRRKSDHLILIAKMIDHLNMLCAPPHSETEELRGTSSLYGLLRGDEHGERYEEDEYETQHEEYELETSSSSEGEEEDEEDEEDEEGGVYWWRSSDEDREERGSFDLLHCQCELCLYNPAVDQGLVQMESEQTMSEVEAAVDNEPHSISL